MERQPLGARKLKNEGEEGDSRTERGGSHVVCEERSFLNASFIQEHFVYTRALLLRCYCAGLS